MFYVSSLLLHAVVLVDKLEWDVPKKQLDDTLLIRETPQVRDVLISGGDGLLINDKILEYVLKNLREIPHVEIIRIGTRAPVVFPQRITENLCNIIKKISSSMVKYTFQYIY